MPTYGVIQNDGSVKSYPSEALASRAGRLEAQVIKHHYTWYFPATGREYDENEHYTTSPGLQPWVASEELWQALVKLRWHRLVTGGSRGVISRYTGADNYLVQTDMKFLKPEPDLRMAWDKQLDRIKEQVLCNMPGFQYMESDGDEPYYNYIFMSVYRLRYQHR